MFLKRIVLHGFKSFADRTEFEFGPGLTAIVGPNGCGKSNVLDAVRWVLGEQSPRSLRGGKMADVIFAGSRSRKPATFAHVELFFDNSTGIIPRDEEGISVGRTLYADGESEYRLNGEPCRLKDVRDLFLDTGVGVDAYSVIEQGRVDLLLQSSPVERREIFEEAAGISRYKVRRAEAQRKLERTQENLLRLQDILEELERRLRSVRLAAGKARNFQEYDARLRELRAAFSLAEYHELEQGRLAAQREIDRLTGELEARRAELAARDAEAAERAHAAQALDEQIQAAEARLLALQTDASALAERIAQGERRVAELAAVRARRQAQTGELAERLEALRRRRAADEAALAQLRSIEEDTRGRIASLEQARAGTEARAAEARGALEREKVAAFEAVRQAALLQNEQANLAAQRGRLGAQAERLAARRAEIGREQQQLAQRVAELAAAVAALDQQAAVLAAELRAREAELEALARSAADLDGQIAAAREARTGVLSRLALLEDMERRLEGVDEGTRTVLTWRESGPLGAELVGLVADVLRIDDPRVDLLQPVLSTFESHVLVRTAAPLLEAVQQHGGLAGPLRVLALDRLPVRAAPAGYEGTPGFVGRAADWVQCPAEFRRLAEHLLGRVIVVDTLERALRLAAEALAGYVFVTLDGWTAWPDGRLTRGTLGPSAGLISRKAEIRQLRAERDEVETRLERLVRERGAVEQARGDAQLRREGLLEQIATVQRTHAEQRSAQARAAELGQRLEREAGLVGAELEGVQRGLAELEAGLRQVQSAGAAAGESQRGHEQRVEALGRELDELEAAVARLLEEHAAARVAAGRAAEKRVAAEEALGELDARMAAVAGEQAAAAREAEEAGAQIAAAEQELAEARAQEAAGRAACAREQGAVLGLREQRQALRQQAEERGAAAREVQHAIAELEAAWHEAQLGRRELEVRTESLAARVRDELGLDLAEQYRGHVPAERDWAAVRQEIEELRGKIARLGNVNLDALAELEELTPRYEHLVAQRADLNRSLARLEALIAELDEESRARFARTFEQIRANFQEMFRKLFGGGKADILLEDPANPLECGIEIIARPPGKEPQSISLLSGGEKTLTAVALLMGVFKCRPSPFAILDEVDAALDESNVDRFNALLNEFLSHTQFVVITHSKRTMACVDVLYGITMEEPGVSQRVSVRFDQCVQAPSVA